MLAVMAGFSSQHPAANRFAIPFLSAPGTKKIPLIPLEYNSIPLEHNSAAKSLRDKRPVKGSLYGPARRHGLPAALAHARKIFVARQTWL